MSFTDLTYRATFIALLVGATGLVAFGQQVYAQGPNSRSYSPPFIMAGVGLFMLAYWIYRKRALPGWLLALSNRLQASPLQIVFLTLAIACAFAARLFAGDSMRMASPTFAVAAGLASVSLVIAGSYRAGAAPKPWPRWARREVIALGLLFGIALLLRVVNNGNIPAALTGDEGSTGLSAMDWVAGRLNNPFIAAWYSFPSLYFTLPAASIALLGNKYAALRLPSAVAGALTVVAAYWMARPMFGRLAAALSATLLAALHFHIHFSRIGLNNIWDAFFMAAVLGMFWRGWQSGRRHYFVGAGLLLGLSQYFYASARVLPFVMLAWIVLWSLAERKRVHQHMLDLFYMVLVASVACLPLMLYYVAYPAEYAAPMNRVSILSNNWLAATSARLGIPAWQLLLNNYRDAALAFTTLPLRSWYNAGHSMLLPATSTYFILGLILAILNLRDSRYWLLLLWLASVVTIAALTESTPAGQRYIIGAPAAAMIAGLALATMARWALDVWHGGRWAVYGAVILLVTASSGADLRFYFWEYAPKFGVGDTNTQVATKLGLYLAGYPSGAQVYFFGPPRMAYAGWSTIPFLAPQVRGQDVFATLTDEPDWPAPTARIAVVFLPEREPELTWVRSRFPGGTLQWFYGDDGRRLFLV